MYKVQRLKIYENFQNKKNIAYSDKIDCSIIYVREKYNLNNSKCVDSVIKNHLLKNFFNKFSRKWEMASRKGDKFLSQNEKWLSSEIVVYSDVELNKGKSLKKIVSYHNSGRPEKSFDDCTERSKRRKVEGVRQNYSATELSFAASIKLRDEGHEKSAKILKQISEECSKKSTEISKKRKADIAKVPSKMSPEEAIVLIITSDLTRQQYISIRKTAVCFNHDLYPSYDSIVIAKNAAYPKDITITETFAEVKLQSLLHHTCERILKHLDNPSNFASDNYILHFKWGFDGSSGHARYQQSWKDSAQDTTDESMLLTSLVPLRLISSETQTIIWKNPRPSSTRFCRPIRLQMKSETKEVCNMEKSIIDSQINKLEPYTYGHCTINFSGVMTMIDGKVCNAVTASSSMKCYICGATCSQLNNLEKIKNCPENSDMLSFGLSVLHCHIRFFECLLHISYRLDIKSWRVSSKSHDRVIMQARKQRIQDEFKNKVGLLVDIVKPGYGTTNDGNTARRFFANADVAAEITGIDRELIARFATILKTISTGYEIDNKKFDTYCMDTAKLYVKLYPWYYMPPSVHKVLIHGSSIIQDSLVPIGDLSEEALEARHKHIRQYREHHARKSSRLHTMEDVFKRLMLTSDPLISLTENYKTKNIKDLDEEVQYLLQFDQ